MDISKIFEPPSDKIWTTIRAKYNEDPNVVESQIKEFRSWLKGEPDVPKDIGEQLIRNIIRFQECDLEEAKKRFKRYWVSRDALRMIVQSRSINEEYFKKMIHRVAVAAKNLTPEGYRIGILKIPANIEEFKTEELIYHLLLLDDLIVHLDSCAGYIGLYDLRNVSLDLFDKINIEILKEFWELLFNIEPVRIKNVHLINMPKIPDKIRNVLANITKPEIVEKVYIHEDLSKLKDHLPEDVIPKEYGGTLSNFEELAEGMKMFLIQNKDWFHKTANPKSHQLFPKETLDLYDLRGLEDKANVSRKHVD